MAFKTAQNQGKSVTNEIKNSWRPMKILIAIIAPLLITIAGSAFAYMWQRSEINRESIAELKESKGIIIERLDGLSKQMNLQYNNLKVLIKQQNRK